MVGSLGVAAKASPTILSAKAILGAAADSQSHRPLVELPELPETVWLTTIEAGYTLLRPIPIRLESTDGGVLASFENADIHSSGDAMSEALRNIGSLILDIYDLLSSESPSALGPGPQRQLSMLRLFIDKANDAD